MEDELVSRIGKRIKTLRKERGLTLDTLSERTHVTKGLLSKIENSRTIPSLPVFLKLIQGLDLQATDFFENLELVHGKNYLHIKKGEYQRTTREDRPGFEYLFILGQTMLTSTVQAYLLHVHPKALSKPSTTDGYEFKHILSGRCYYRIDKEEILLEEGDTLLFDASVPHHPRNPFRKKVTMLVLYFLTTK